MKRQPTDKRQRYAIKKLTIGVVSVATGASILLYSPQVLAEEANQDQTTELTTSETASKNQATETLATSQPSTTPETVNTDAVSEKTADNATVGTEIAQHDSHRYGDYGYHRRNHSRAYSFNNNGGWSCLRCLCYLLCRSITL